VDRKIRLAAESLTEVQDGKSVGDKYCGATPTYATVAQADVDWLGICGASRAPQHRV
jgi:hypothetical protein